MRRAYTFRRQVNEKPSSIPGCPDHCVALYLEVHALLALEDADELTGDDTALVDELVEGVLPIGTGLSKVHLARLEWQPAAIDRHPLTIALHRHLKPASMIV